MACADVWATLITSTSANGLFVAVSVTAAALRTVFGGKLSRIWRWIGSPLMSSA